MSESLVPVFLMVAVAAGMAGALILLTHAKDWVRGSKTFVGRVLGPKVPIDRSPYECGMRPFDRVQRHRFSVHFYLVAMLFILFDIEVAFLFPWAVTFRGFADDRMFVLIEMAVFLGILIAGFAYVWKRGALEWE